MVKTDKPATIFPAISEEYRKLYGDDLISITLYGSAAGGDYRPGKSDLNFLIVLSEEAIDHLDRAIATVSRWRKKGVATPLFMTTSYIDSSLDSYPLEFLNMRESYLLVYGTDVLGGIAFGREHLRLQCEREIKGKLLLLRERFLETEGKTKRIQALIAESITAFISIFRGLLYLKDVAIPSTRREIVEALTRELRIDADTFLHCLDIKEGKKLPPPETDDAMKKYLAEVRRLWNCVDTLE